MSRWIENNIICYKSAIYAATINFILVFLFSTACDAAEVDIKVGQVWSIKGAPISEKIIIGRIEIYHNQPIVHLTIVGIPEKLKKMALVVLILFFMCLSRNHRLLYRLTN